jgi:hypothetical protein
MSNVRKFDETAVVVDWIDACKSRHLDKLLDLYEDTATIECCEGGVFQGRSAMEEYWRPRLARSRSVAFEIDALFPERDGVFLDYRGHDEKPVRTFVSSTKRKDPHDGLRTHRGGRIAATSCRRAKAYQRCPRSRRTLPAAKSFRSSARSSRSKEWRQAPLP